MRIILNIIGTACVYMMLMSLDMWEKPSAERGHETDRRFWMTCAIIAIIIMWLV